METTTTKKASAPKKTALISDYRKLRRKLDLNQSEFWNRLGVTQSNGSRYESGRPVPKPTAMLAVIAYGTQDQANAMIAALRPQETTTKEAQ